LHGLLFFSHAYAIPLLAKERKATRAGEPIPHARAREPPPIEVRQVPVKLELLKELPDQCINLRDELPRVKNR
jgi:hypothetical protein